MLSPARGNPPQWALFLGMEMCGRESLYSPDPAVETKRTLCWGDKDSGLPVPASGNALLLLSFLAVADFWETLPSHLPSASRPQSSSLLFLIPGRLAMKVLAYDVPELPQASSSLQGTPWLATSQPGLLTRRLLPSLPHCLHDPPPSDLQPTL